MGWTSFLPSGMTILFILPIRTIQVPITSRCPWYTVTARRTPKSLLRTFFLCTFFIRAIRTIWTSIAYEKPTYACACTTTLKYNKKKKASISIKANHMGTSSWQIFTWKVPGMHPVLAAEQRTFIVELVWLSISILEHSHTPRTHCEWGSALWHCWSFEHGSPRDTTPSPLSTRVRTGAK